MRSLSALPALITLTLATALPATAQTWSVVEDDDWCREHEWRERFCEVRETTLDGDRETIVVDAEPNGGIEVEAWDRDEIRLRVKITVWDEDREDAEEIAGRIEIETGDEIRADGPTGRREDHWAVSYRLLVPERSNLVLETHNGGLTVVGVTGEIELATHNGGIRLADVDGDVVGQTRNGGISVRLNGDAWEGEGLDLESRNGGIHLEVPRDYSAKLLTATVNGGIVTDLPVSAREKRGGTIKATLGDGGALLRLVTRNGGIRVETT